jgi:phenylpropionate dioxygenase-like ring-hydroxylating dioxygenase large terminal subunit
MATLEASIPASTGTQRADFLLPKDIYLSPQIAKLEKERLWPKVWQMAGRVEQLRNIGSYLTYDIGDDAVIVIRTSEQGFKAFHNACQHRGRRILDAEGQIQEIACRFHGWRWHLNGTIKSVTERHDWANCSHMTDADIALKPVLVDTWGGWIFINLDEKAGSLAKFLDPVAERCAPYEFEKLRTRWFKTVIVKCNWKVAVEAFNEFYHVTATHAQLQRYQDDVSRCYTFGDHGMMSYPPELNRMWGSPAARTGMPIPSDYREAIVAGVDEFERTLKAIWSPRAVAATHRLMTELPADTSPEVALGKMVEFWREAAIAEGAGWPNITPQQAADAGYDWHVFPNFLFLMGPDAAIFYRVRPNGDDHESCIFDIWSMVRYVPGGEPQVEHEVYARWQDCDSLGLILTQDFTNMEHVHHGMKSRGFSAARTNPLQESVLVNFHRAIRDYLSAGKSS